MKKIVLTLMILSVVSLAYSQQVVTKYMDKYENDETFTKVSVSSKMFSLFAEMEGSEEDEQLFYDITSKLKGMKVLASEKVSKPKELYDGAVSDVEKAGAKASTKILFPLMGFIVPAVFIVIASPIVIEAMLG